MTERQTAKIARIGSSGLFNGDTKVLFVSLFVCVCFTVIVISLVF